MCDDKSAGRKKHRRMNPTSSTVHLSPAITILSCKKQECLNSSKASGEWAGLDSLLHGLLGSAPPRWSWHSSTGKWKLALLYNWLSICRLEQYTSIRDALGIRMDICASLVSGSSVSSGSREVGAGLRLRRSLVNVSLSSSTAPDGLVMSSLNTTLASLRRTPTDNWLELKQNRGY